MATRVNPESKEQVEARTRKQRDRAAGKVNSVTYKLSCTVDHSSGIGGTIDGPRAGSIHISIRRGLNAQNEAHPLELEEAQLEPLIEFLRFVKEEILTLRENYDSIDDTTE